MTNCDKCKLYRDALDSLLLKIDRAIARIEGYAADMVCDTGDETAGSGLFEAARIIRRELHHD